MKEGGSCEKQHAADTESNQCSSHPNIQSCCLEWGVCGEQDTVSKGLLAHLNPCQDEQKYEQEQDKETGHMVELQRHLDSDAVKDNEHHEAGLSGGRQCPVDSDAVQSENEDEASLPEELQRPLDSGAVQSTNEDEASLPEELQRPLDSGAVQCEDEDESNLLEEPQCPLDSDCCGNGCSPCVFDLYERDLAVWRRRREQARLGPALTPSGPSAAALSPDHYTALPLLDVTPVSDDAAVYRFALPTGTALCLRPGQHLVLREHDAAGRPLTRPYTPVSPRDAAGYFDVYIRRYADGAASACVRRWRPGLHVRWRGPFGKFQPRAGDARLVLLAAGTGVAPFVALVRAVLADEADETRLVLLLAVRRLRDVFPRDELAEFARAWNFTYTLFVSGGEEDSARYGEPVRWRRPGSQDVQEVVRQMALKTRYLVCGTRSFEKDMLNYLGAAGVQDDDIFRF